MSVKDVSITPDNRAAAANLQPASEATAAGEQTLLGGVAPVTAKDRVQAAAAKPMTGGNAAPPAGGLFDEGARQQVDLLDAIAAGQDAEGRLVLTTHADMVAEAERSDLLADVISSCRE